MQAEHFARARLAALRLLLGAGVLIALIGALHAPAARPLLNALRGAPGCPVDLDGANPEIVEAHRIAQLRRLQGTTPTRSRVALGFELGAARKQDVLRELDAAGATCTPNAHGNVLRCRDLPRTLNGESHAGAPIVDLHLQFSPSGTLVALDALRENVPSDRALRQLAERGERVDRTIGVTGVRDGERDASTFEARGLARASISYRAADLVVTLSALRISRGARVREQYQWIPG